MSANVKGQAVPIPGKQPTVVNKDTAHRIVRSSTVVKTESGKTLKRNSRK